jgi:hypothetical protein
LKINLTSSLVKAVEISMGHITKSDSELLASKAGDYRYGEFGSLSGAEINPVVMENAHGFVIAVGALTVESIKGAGASVEFAAILDACILAGDIMYLCFDRDAIPHHDLPVFNW